VGALFSLLPVNHLEAGEIDFAKQVRPIFVAHCVKCHGPQKQNASLRVDAASSMLKGGDSGPAIMPGQPDKGELIYRISSTENGVRMPPEGESLSAEQIATIRRWIQEGAKAPIDEPLPDPRLEHWSYQPITLPDVPQIGSGSRGGRNPIDALLQTKLAEHGLAMSPEADPYTFIRRVTLDLTGLPPTPEEVEEFVAECKANEAAGKSLPDEAVERLIDRLLASSRYGERWAQHWLDVIRYADTDGCESNGVRPNAWPYRDYVIQAMNKDIPYPQFIMEQLAGDAVGVDEATGFLVTSPFPIRAEVGQETDQVAQVRFNGLDEILQNVGASMLGMTIGCARCHDHKFDPVTMRDYYRLVATFAGVQSAARPWRNGHIPLKERAEAERRVDEIRRELRKFPSWRETYNGRYKLGTTDAFEPVRAKWVRLTILNTQFQRPKYPAAIDELEVWSAEEDGIASRNVASAARGAVGRSSGADPERGGSDAFLNDGRHGKDSVWIGMCTVDEGAVYVEIELPQPEVIDRLVWSLDPDDQGFEAPDEDHIPVAWRTPTVWTIDVAEQPGKWRTVVSKVRDNDLSKTDADRRKSLEQQFASAWERLWQLTYVFAGRFEKPEPVHVLTRGDPFQPRELTGAGGVDVLGGYELDPDAPEPDRRVALAKWLGSEKNPLTARVLVNRVWRHHFGSGIVETPSDFGLRGELPSHPELLDWLTCEFMARGWRLKDLHRLICSSAAYRQSSPPNAKASEIDADARWLWRFPPRRLEAEAIRDSMLGVSGSIDFTMGGPSVNIYRSAGKGNSGWLPPEKPNPQSWRRTIYLTRIRGADDGVFKAFDVPDCGQVRPKRSESTTPLQALNLFNSPFVIEQAGRLAQRVKKEAGPDLDKQIDRLFLITLARLPLSEERTFCRELVGQDDQTTLCRALLNSNEFLFLR